MSGEGDCMPVHAWGGQWLGKYLQIVRAKARLRTVIREDPLLHHFQSQPHLLPAIQRQCYDNSSYVLSSLHTYGLYTTPVTKAGSVETKSPVCPECT
jgi:hypothetical protein